MVQNIYSDKILYLNSPKLITNFKNNSNNYTFNSQPTNLIISNKINKSILNNDIGNNKFDKRYKNNLVSQDNVEIKKSKVRTSKKYKKQEILENEELFFNQSSSVLNSHKITKYKKKNKKFNANQNNTINNSDSSRVDKDIIISRPLTVQELSNQLNISEAKIITDLFLQGISVTINDLIDIDISIEIAKKYDFNIVNPCISSVKSSEKIDYNDSLIKRPPLITILGHVDHGKTTLFDAILNTQFTSQEFGGITQNINGYEIDHLYNNDLYKLVFIDTPGHEAFSSMRFRGSKITDIALLVVAADDGLKPQTIESIKYILEMDLLYIVVINKIDKKNINISKIKENLMAYNIISQDLGGDAVFVEVSALENINIDLLLSNICLISDLNKFVSNPNRLAEGTVLESHLNKKQGLIANLVIQNGSLKIGDWIVAGHIYGKVKNIKDFQNNRLNEALPSSIVKVLGFSSSPESGISFQVVSTEKEAKIYINSFNYDSNTILNNSLKSLNSRVTFNREKNLKKLNLIIKTDTQGSLEAIINSLSKISQSKVQFNILSADASNISNTDLELALATNSIIIAFGLDISLYINHSVKQNSLILKTFNIIYDLLDYIKTYMLDLIDIEYEHLLIGNAIVKEVFFINKGLAAGCLVTEGKIKKSSYICIYRNKDLVYEGYIISLKHLKEDIEEVVLNKECGIMCDYNEWEKGDIIYAYELHPKEKSL